MLNADAVNSTVLLTARQHRRRLEGALFLEIELFDREWGEQLLAAAVEDRLQFRVGEITVLAKIVRHDRGHLVLLTLCISSERSESRFMQLLYRIEFLRFTRWPLRAAAQRH